MCFAFHVLCRYKKAPIIILDEPDGSLDHRNVSRFTKFLSQNNNLQIIVITHCHRRAYAVFADDCIGIVREVRLNVYDSSLTAPSV
jgi:chromosome segregation ATPase